MSSPKLQPAPAKIILGLDLATKITGWAYLSLGDPLTLLDCGTLESSADDYLTRWQEMLMQLDLVMEAHGSPCAVAIEHPNSPRNMETVRQLVGIWAAVCVHLIDRGYWPTEVNTKHAKLVFTGNGRAEKRDTVAKANEIFAGQMESPFKLKDNDKADAIQVAYTLRKELLEMPEFQEFLKQ
jgi:Holliday junction resolvasome RuvABC endonuclease subunit